MAYRWWIARRIVLLGNNERRWERRVEAHRYLQSSHLVPEDECISTCILMYDCLHLGPDDVRAWSGEGLRGESENENRSGVQFY